MGRNLHDPLDAVQVVNAPQLKETFGVSFGGIARVLKAIPEWRHRRSGILTTNFAEAGGFVKSQASEAIPDLQLHFVIAKLVDHGRKTVLGHGYSGHVCVLRPQSRGSITLASADPMAAPLIDPNFLDHPDDVQRMVRGFRLMRHLFSQPALARLGGHEHPRSAGATTDAEIEQFIRAHGDTIYHPVGTCRMGPGAMDVVGADLRIHGLDGIRVVDAFDHAAHHRRQHQRADDHGGGEGVRHDQGGAPGGRGRGAAGAARAGRQRIAADRAGGLSASR